MAQTSLTLLLLMIVISPITQNMWKGDNFLHGQDTETHLIVGLTLASISLLRMQRGRDDIDETFRRVKDFLSSIFGAWPLLYLGGGRSVVRSRFRSRKAAGGQARTPGTSFRF